MSARLITTALCLFVATMASAAELTVIRVYTGWRDAASFKRISEYFSGKENTQGQTILRTQPDDRAGYYFLVRADNAGSARKVTARLQVITDATAKPVEFQFYPELASGETVFHLGLTGRDWPNASANPVAWKLDLSDADGQTLVSEQSYLWETPRAK